MPDFEIGLADGSEFNFEFNLSCSLMQRKKYMGRVFVDLNRNDEY